MYGYIYKTTNKINGKIYIGQKKSNRFLGNSYLGSGRYLNNAITKYGRENFSVELIKECNSAKDLDDSEIYYISLFNSKCRDIGYNLQCGGHNTKYLNCWVHKYKINKRIKREDVNSYIGLGWKFGRLPCITEEGRRRIREASKNRIVSQETREKLRQKGIGHSVSEETRKKIGQKNKGCKRSPEFCRKISEAQRNREYHRKPVSIEESTIHANTARRVHTGRKRSEITKQRISNARKGSTSYAKGTTWMTNGTIDKRVLPSDILKYLENGFLKGRCK